jgi:hypothetical protein
MMTSNKKTAKRQNITSRRSKRNNQNTKSSLNGKPATLNWDARAQLIPRMNNLIKTDNRPYKFVQSSAQGVVLTSATSTQGFARAWTAADILQFNSFSQVFDQYRIDMIECWFTPIGPGLSSTYIADTRFYSVVDYDDTNTITSAAVIQEYTNCVTTPATNGHYIKFVPHVGVLQYVGALPNSSGNLGLQNKRAGWNDCAYTNVQHFGVKIVLDPTTSSADIKIDLFTRITVSFKNVY